MALMYGYVVIVAIPIAMLFAYFAVIYPELPQALGGPHARCAKVAIKTEKWPPDLFVEAGGERIGGGEAQAIVFSDAQVLYNDDKTLLFRPYGAGTATAPIELRKELIGALVWCPD